MPPEILLLSVAPGPRLNCIVELFPLRERIVSNCCFAILDLVLFLVPDLSNPSARPRYPMESVYGVDIYLW